MGKLANKSLSRFFFLLWKFNIPLGPLSKRGCKKQLRLASLRKRKYYAQKFLHQDDPGNCHNHPDHHHLSDWMVVEVMHLPSDRHSRFLASLLIERTSGRQKAKCICDNFKTYFSAQKIFDIVKCHICCIVFRKLNILIYICVERKTFLDQIRMGQSQK